MNARTLPASLTALYDVTLKFADGIYKRRAVADSPERAIELALVDARMASPFETFGGVLLESSAELVSEPHAAWHRDLEIVGWGGMS